MSMRASVKNGRGRLRGRGATVGTALIPCLCAAALASESVEDLLADRFIDRSFGYSLRPPINCHIDAQKKFAPNGAYRLVEFNHLDRVWSLEVSVFRLEQARSAGDLLAGLQRESLLEHPDHEVLERSLRTIAARPGGVLATRYVDIERPLIDLHAVILFDRQQVFAVRFRAGQHDADTVRPLFDAILASFEFTHSELTHQLLDEALLRGAGVLSRAAELRLSQKVVPQTHMLVTIDGQEVGYATITETAENRRGAVGVHIRERGWLFLDGGVVHQIRNDFFLSDDMTAEEFETRLLILTPAADDRPPQILEQLEQGVREHDKLVLAYSEQTGDSVLANDVLAVPPGYLPKAAHRMLPRLLPLEHGGLYAFASYSNSQRGLVLHTVRVESDESIPRGAGAAVRYKMLDGEGITPPYAEVYCDQAGRIVRLVLGNQTFTATSRETVERVFGSRVQLAQREIEQILTRAR